MNPFPISKRFLVLLLCVLVTPSLKAASPRPDTNKPITGAGIIDRIPARIPDAGSQPGSASVFRADGYTIRILPTTELHFGKGLQALREVSTNTLAIFSGEPDDSGTIVATKAAFVKLNLHKSKPDPNALQFTTPLPGNRIDGSTGFATGPKAFLKEDHGGWCGWYYVPSDPAMQESMIRLGQKLVPQYQRELPDNDPTKIPFRFYLVEETEIRSAIFCGKGLILVPIEVVHRLQNEDQLAAVLAEGIAGELQQQVEAARGFTLKDAAEMAPYLMGFGGWVPGVVGEAGEMVIRHKVKSSVEHELSRMALSYMADVGFDPHQAPESWRLLEPAQLPKNPARLKYPERSRYIQSILERQYKPVSGSKAAEDESKQP